jgi:UDP-N-acetylmuramoylalanine--D-glutamate ligase
MKKRIVVLGAGESGTGSAILALKQALMCLSRIRERKDTYRDILSERNSMEEGSHTDEKILEADEVIKSPELRRFSMVIRLREKGVPVFQRLNLPADMRKE